ncbi:tagaturonate reductase [Adhaeribacter aquaticus]|uniref:tagaturonate reductase n=1 Tax=Adhaeribacter aquaticus TaxID=299567 RepID=UPI0003FB7B8F|nr:tagaturonate reductase [Adhaeribacter aquaticus]
MLLNQENLGKIKAGSNLLAPSPDLFELPEKVLQFGTGVLLRGLPDYFIHKANQEGVFNGRVVVVKSTDKGDTAEFDQQDNLYTICVRGFEDGQKVEANIICSAISRVLTAGNNWEEILTFATSPELSVVISNTTEVGIQLVEDDVNAQPPVSFPGKLLAVLLKRYKAFNGDRTKGLVIVPTELISENGTQLKAIVVELARQNNLEEAFIQWVTEANIFCNTLVDRIVPGKPDAALLANLEAVLGYQDDLLIMSEVYRLWAIEGNEQVKEKLSFAQTDAGVIVEPDINRYRELKLRLLNGTHTLSCGLAFLGGIQTVKEAMDDKNLSAFISGLMQEDIAPAIPYEVAPEEAADFSRKVLDRFRNTHIEHQWLSITMNYTMKLKMRVVPVLQQYYHLFNQAPEHVAFGFAAYLLFMKAKQQQGEKYFGELNNTNYLINDEHAAYFYQLWQSADFENIADEVLKNQEFWGADLTILPGFAQTVQKYLLQMSSEGVLAALKSLESRKISVA